MRRILLTMLRGSARLRGGALRALDLALAAGLTGCAVETADRIVTWLGNTTPDPVELRLTPPAPGTVRRVSILDVDGFVAASAYPAFMDRIVGADVPAKLAGHSILRVVDRTADELT